MSTSATALNEVLIPVPLGDGKAGPVRGGHLVIIGGGERPDSVMQKIIELAGGAAARLVVISTASETPAEVAFLQQCELQALGAGYVDHFCCAAESCEADLSRLREATGVFFSGGDQRKLARSLLGTPALEAIRVIYKRGGVIAGTSAGAAVMSKLMITGDEYLPEGHTDHQHRIIHTSDGFGFMEGVIIDQHFVKRSRHYRLRNLISRHPELLGIGIDEATAIVVSPDGTFSTIGESQVLVFTATPRKRPADSSLHLVEPVAVTVLAPGSRYSVTEQRLLNSLVPDSAST